MSDFLLELLSEEIPARMQAKACADLARLFGAQLAEAGLKAESVGTWATPRRLALIARGLPERTEAVSEEIKGPRVSAPPQALEGFLRKTGLSRDRLVERDGVLFAVIERPGRDAADVLAEAIPAVVRAFPWPKSMRWGAASISTESLRWVRPLHGIVALLGERIVEFEVAGVKSGAATVGHRFHHPGAITIGSANDYVEKLRACRVILDAQERREIIREGAERLAAEAGLTLVEDEGLLAENAGLTEWPVPLLGSFDPAFLDVPPEVIRLTMRTNQKYFALTDGEGRLAPNFICVANIEASDGGAAIAEGNRKVLAARLADARYFWEHDLKVPLEQQARKLAGIVFHEKLGTLADKVERVAKLARWLGEEGIVKSSPSSLGEGDHAQHGGGTRGEAEGFGANPSTTGFAGGPPPRDKLGEDQRRLADLAETAARLCKADLVTGLVGEFPELQGIIGGHLARAQGQPPEVADAIRDHYKPAGQGDEVPTAPVTVAVSLADKLDTVFAFLAINEPPTGSRDPFALRRQILGVISILLTNRIRLPLRGLVEALGVIFQEQYAERMADDIPGLDRLLERYAAERSLRNAEAFRRLETMVEEAKEVFLATVPETSDEPDDAFVRSNQERRLGAMYRAYAGWNLWFAEWEDVLAVVPLLVEFATDRLKVQQREAGVRHDLIDAVFALGGEDDLVRLLARVKALQAFVETAEGADLLAGYKRAANILKKEGWPPAPSPQGGEGRGEGVRPKEQSSDSEHPHPTLSLKREGSAAQKQLSYTPLLEEAALIAALDSAEPRARAAVEAEDFEGAMAALASLRAPVDAFFDKVTVNDPDPDKRSVRLDLLLRMRDAVHRVADFSRIEG